MNSLPIIQKRKGYLGEKNPTNIIQSIDLNDANTKVNFLKYHIKKIFLFRFFLKFTAFVIYLSVFCSNNYAQTRIILEKQNGVYLIPCKVNGLNMKFIFDSGASDVTISLTEAMFMIKNNYLSESNILGSQFYQIANGDIQEGTKIILNSIEIGGFTIKDVEASIVHALDAPLLLGQSALSRLGVFSFDYSTNSLIIGSGSSYVNSEGCFTGNCFDGFGTYYFASGDKYVGENKNGKYSGQGTYTFANGDKYVGEYKDGRCNGYGTFTYAIGDKYVGAFINGKGNGQGTYTFASGEKYVGAFIDGKYNGQGTYTFANGNKYVGEYKDGRYNGYGTYTFANGNQYVGEYKDDKGNGQGTYTFANGDKYVGAFIDGKRNGQGTHTFANGDEYVGTFIDDKGNGQGTYTFANGDKYVGEFKEGKPNGYGTYTYADGDKKEGHFNNGIFIKQ